MNNMMHNFAHELEDELEYEVIAGRWVHIRRIRGAYGESEIESFDPSPPAPGTILLTNYPFGGSNPSATHRGIVRRVVAAVIAKMPEAPNILYCINVDVEGHEDEVGDPGHFGEVGLARALKIAELLQKLLEPQIGKLPAAARRHVNVNVSTAGPVRPIRSNVTEAGRSMNRRVEIRMSVAPCGPIA